jgi:hypothetical protein
MSLLRKVTNHLFPSPQQTGCSSGTVQLSKHLWSMRPNHKGVNHVLEPSENLMGTISPWRSWQSLEEMANPQPHCMFGHTIGHRSTEKKSDHCKRAISQFSTLAENCSFKVHCFSQILLTPTGSLRAPSPAVALHFPHLGYSSTLKTGLHFFELFMNIY